MTEESFTLMRPGDTLAGETACALLFTDIEGSTALLEHLGKLYAGLLLRHNEILRDAIAGAGGVIVSTEGDSVFAVFRNAADAVAGALSAQRRLQHEPWPEGVSVRVRMGVHVGAPRRVNDLYIGLDVHRAARISDSARGGQIVLSREAIEELAEHGAVADCAVRSLGRHRLKDLRYPEALYDIVAPGLMSDFDPVRSLGNRPTNLTPGTEPLFGREADLAAVTALLRDPTRRIVTLVGLGGVGKSSLARRIGEAALEDFGDGAHWVQLGGLSDAGLVFPTIAQTLGVRDFAGRPVILDIAAAIGAERRLLLLDTFEHVVSAGPEVAALVDACPHLRVLVTSRTPVGLRTETVHEVAPLPLPSASARLADVEAMPAVRLFVASVREFDSAFALDEENAPIVARICRRLEGIPLGIELAAGRMRMLGPAKLLDRLSGSLGVLKSGRSDAEVRHRTLHDAIAWSDNLLSPADREVFRGLSVFAGGFGLEDAERVIEAPNAFDIDLIDVVQSLVERSLLRRSVVNGEPRFGMFDMIRDYAQDALAATDGQRRMRDRHLAHFAELAETCGAMALHRRQRSNVLRLMTEADNLRAALDWAVETGDIESFARIFYALHWYWISQGQFTEAQSWSRRGTALAAESAAPGRGAALIHEAACSLSMASGDYVGGLPFSREALRLYEAAQDHDGMHRIGLTHSICATVAGEIEDPSGMLLASIEAFRGRDPYHTALGLVLLGEGARIGGAYDAAEACNAEALALFEGLENVYWPGHLKQNIAHFRLRDGRGREAAVLFAQSYEMAEEYDFPLVSNLSVAGLACVAAHRGRADDAARILGAVERNLEKIGVHFEPTDKADIEHHAMAARLTLGEAAYAIAVAEGVAMEWDEVRKLARAYGAD